MGDQQTWYPSEWGTTTRPRPGRAVRVLMVCLLVFAVGVGGAAGAVLYADSQVSRVTVDNLAEPGDLDGDGVVDMDELTDSLTVLLVGSDSREGLTREQQVELGTGTEEGAEGMRPDTIMLLRLDPVEDRVALLSFPRDLVVERCDGTRGRLNAANWIGEQLGVGGASCLVESVTNFSGITVNHYLEVNFAGFVDIVDALGGVTMYLDEPISDERAHIDLPAGCVTLDPADALGFVRARYIDNDFGRMARQQRFIREVTREMTSAGTLLNVPKLFSLIDAASRTVETDRDLSLRQMRQIAYSLRNVEPERLDTRTVPGELTRLEGASVVAADEEAANQLFRAFESGTVFETDHGTDDEHDDEPALPVDAVAPVTVLNGAGIGGLAADAAQALADRGYEVADTGNVDEFDADTTTRVLYSSGEREAAEQLRDLFGAARVQPNHQGDEPLVVIVGSDYEQSQLVDADGAEANGFAEDPASPPPEELGQPDLGYRGAADAEVRC